MNATACTAAGGNSGDGWAGSQTPNGSTAISESAASSVTYTITCTGGTQSASASVKVTYKSPPSGSGTLDPAWLLALLSVLAVRLRLPRVADPTRG
jgi:hypothetical protein